MSKTLYALATILFAALPTSVRADLGENEAQLEERFGTPHRVEADPKKVAPAEKIVSYRNRDFTVHVSLLGGKSVSEKYEFHEDISSADDPKVRAVLDRQSDGGGWTAFPNPKAIGPDRKYVWARIDGEQEKWANASVKTTSPKALELQAHKFTLLLGK